MPVAFASRKLNTFERRNSPLEKEGLSLFLEVCKFHKYLKVYQRGVNYGNADCISRLMAPGFVEESPVPADVDS